MSIKIKDKVCRNLPEQVAWNDYRIGKLQNAQPNTDFVKKAEIVDKKLKLTQVSETEESEIEFKGGADIKAGSNITIIEDPEDGSNIISASGEISGTVNFVDVKEDAKTNISLKGYLDALEASTTTLSNDLNEEKGIRENADNVLDNKIDELKERLGEELANKQDILTASTGISIDAENLISCTLDLDSKQNKLTEGANIRIENDVISATSVPPENYIVSFDKRQKSGSIKNELVVQRVKDGVTTTTLYEEDYLYNASSSHSTDIVYGSLAGEGVQCAYQISKNSLNNGAVVMTTDLGNIYCASPSEELQAANKQYVDTGLNAKQAKLTAGTNITIDTNNVISATGGSGEPNKYIKDAQVLSGNQLKLVRKDDTEELFEVDISGKLDKSLSTIQTTAPTAAITDGGIHIVHLASSTGVTEYNGYIYMYDEA